MSLAQGTVSQPIYLPVSTLATPGTADEVTPAARLLVPLCDWFAGHADPGEGVPALEFLSKHLASTIFDTQVAISEVH